MKIQTFIFNWRGQYDKTIEKINQLMAIGVQPVVINSDEEHERDDWHNIGEDSYFTAQFLKAIEVFEKGDADVLFHIQADASYENWAPIYADAEKYFEVYNWGIYAPNVDYTWYDSSRTDLDAFELDEMNLRMVANTDCTCWFIHKDILQETKNRGIDFAPYKMGWSFDIVYPAISYTLKRPVIRDYAYTIDHPAGTNYNKDQAEKEMQTLFGKLDAETQKAFYYIKTSKERLYDYYME